MENLGYRIDIFGNEGYSVSFCYQESYFLFDGNSLKFSYTSSNKKEIFITCRRGRISELLKYCNKIFFFHLSW